MAYIPTASDNEAITDEVIEQAIKTSDKIIGMIKEIKEPVFN